MKKDDLFYLGKILKTYGNKGKVLVHLDVDDPSDYEEMESVFLDLHGERIPFFITSFELKHNNKAVLGFQDFDTASDAESMTGLEMYLPLSLLPPLTGNRFYYHEITGFEVIDSERGPIGLVQGVLDLPHQALLQIMHGDREILMPVVDAVISKVDRKKRTIYIVAPAGLIDLYL